MDSLSLCWRGMAGSGKRTQLHEALRAVAAARGVPFNIQLRSLGKATTTADVTGTAAATEEGVGPADAEANEFQHEYSLVHFGLDVARMSMQDKRILYPILTRLGQGSQVMAGEQGRGARILVLYHAHLLSTESVLLLQACLEQNEGDLSVWLTSELPVPQRIRDWFVEIAVAGDDHTFEAYREAVLPGAATPVINWPDIFRALIDRWEGSPPPKLQEIKEVKAYVYEMLMRNLRWVEVTHFLLDVILAHEGITDAKRRAAIAALAGCEATAGGYTIPSYRIPILWEHLFLQLRSIFAKESLPETDGAAAAPARPVRTRTTSRRGATATATATRTASSRARTSNAQQQAQPPPTEVAFV